MKPHRPFFAAAAVLASLLAPGALVADVQKVGADGVVHRVDVEPVTVERAFYTQIRYTTTQPGGERGVTVVPGTEDVALEREPAIEIDPSTGNVVFVWVRNDGSGYELFVTRREGNAWMPTRRLIAAAGDARRPQIRIAKNLVHVSWRQDNGGSQRYYRASFDRGTFDAAFGPEAVPAAPPPPSASGSDPTTVDPPRGDKYFAGQAPGMLPGDPGSVVVWGVRDEPVPIDYVYFRPLPADAGSVIQAEASPIASKFVLWFETVNRLYYSIRAGGEWGELRFVDLSPTTSPSDAKLQVREMILRGGI